MKGKTDNFLVNLDCLLQLLFLKEECLICSSPLGAIWLQDYESVVVSLVTSSLFSEMTRKALLSKFAYFS